MEHKLTPKQKIFVQEYIYDWNATRAAIAAGYSEKTAFTIGCENLKNPYIQEYITEIQKDIEKLCGISRQQVLDEYRKIAFSNITHLHNTWIERKEFEKLTEHQKACIQEIDTKIITKNIGTVMKPEIVDIEHIKIKLYSKQAALDSIAKMLGYNEAEKHNLKQTHVVEYKNVSKQFPDE